MRVREAGIGASAAASLARAQPSDVEAIARDLRQIGALLEESLFPETEWRRLLEIFDRDGLAALVGVSPSSVARYARGERRTPDEAAARLHLLALIAGDLAGAYNNLGIRRWFERPRTALDGRTPADLLRGRWRPDGPDVLRVRALARALLDSPAT
jgi:transcriptional regulator with XRE-family HTH domain